MDVLYSKLAVFNCQASAENIMKSISIYRLSIKYQGSQLCTMTSTIIVAITLSLTLQILRKLTIYKITAPHRVGRCELVDELFSQRLPLS